jgi:hypothetical protein
MMIRKLLIALTFSSCAFYSGQTTTIFQENFEPATASLWNNTDRDGDGEKWEFYNAEEDDIPAFTGGFATSWSWFFEAFTPDNTLSSPAINLPVTPDLLYLKFKVGAFDEELFQEHYAVYLIPANSTFSGTEFPVFEETLDAGYTQVAKNVMVDVTSFAGQEVRIVLRHFNCTDIAFIAFDDVEIYKIPYSDFIKIKNVQNLKMIRMYDSTGKLIKESNEAEINVQSLLPGTYILNIHTGNEIFSERFIRK